MLTWTGARLPCATPSSRGRGLPDDPPAVPTGDTPYYRADRLAAPVSAVRGRPSSAGRGARSGTAPGGSGGHSEARDPRLQLVEAGVERLQVAPCRDGEPRERPLDRDVDQLLQLGPSA